MNPIIPKNSPPTAQASPDTEAPPDSTLSQKPVVIPENFDLDDQDETWFEELVEQVQAPENTHSRWNYEFDQIIQPGESIITEGWEVSEGIFQFTTLTSDGVVAACGAFPEEISDLRKLGVDTAFNLYARAGNGFANHVISVLGQQRPDLAMQWEEQD